jgi:hypothetical protein
MRFLNLSGPGIANDEEFCPHCHVMLEDRGGYQVCRLCHYDTRRSTRQRCIRLRRREGRPCPFPSEQAQRFGSVVSRGPHTAQVLPL